MAPWIQFCLCLDATSSRWHPVYNFHFYCLCLDSLSGRWHPRYSFVYVQILQAADDTSDNDFSALKHYKRWMAPWITISLSLDTIYKRQMAPLITTLLHLETKISRWQPRIKNYLLLDTTRGGWHPGYSFFCVQILQAEDGTPDTVFSAFRYYKDPG